MTIRERLRAIRHTIFEQLEMADTPKALFKLQSAIATQIQKSERVAQRDKTGEHKWHINLLRCYGDAIVWRLLSPHTIRQLAKNPAKPPSLTGQGRSFQHTLKLAKKYAEAGTPILVADITNCIKIGDIINCHDPERPIICECKANPKPGQLIHGRTGRQLSRALQVTKYLYTGKARLYGEERTSLKLETSVEAEFTWEAVNQAVKEALVDGEGLGITSDNDIVWAYLADKEHDEIPQQVRTIISKFETVSLGCHARALEETSPLVPPPAVWPIAHNCRFALMEVEVLLMHFIDVGQFTKIKSKHGRIVDISRDKAGINGFVVEAQGKRQTLLYPSLERVLYGFQTIESTGKTMIEAAKQWAELDASCIPPESNYGHKPKAIVISTKEEANQLAKDANAYSHDDIVFIPLSLYNQFYHEAQNLENIEIPYSLIA